MANCIYCGAEAPLYRRETLLCVKCAEAIGAEPSLPTPPHKDHARRILLLELAEATARAEAASAEFKIIMRSIPSGIPHPDGARRIHQASHDLSNARKDVMQAHSRLENFLRTGLIPQDLKGTENGE